MAMFRGERRWTTREGSEELEIQEEKREWQAYFGRTLPDASLEERITRYEHHTKYGPTRDYWTEFVFEAYVNHRTEVIFLAGLPDVAESRPQF